MHLTKFRKYQKNEKKLRNGSLFFKLTDLYTVYLFWEYAEK